MNIEFTEKQNKLLAEAGIPYDPLRDYTYAEIEEIDGKIVDYMLKSCYDPGYTSTEKSELAEDMITYLVRLREKLN